MTPEFRALLERIAAAGGPVAIQPGDLAVITLPDGKALDHWFKPWSSLADAALIAALKADLIGRGFEWHASYYRGRDSGPEHHVAHLYPPEAKTMAGVLGKYAEGPHEATVWAEAWLLVSKQTEATE